MTERELMILRRARPTDVWYELCNESKRANLENRMREQQNSNLITIDKRQMKTEFEKAIAEIVKNMKL